MDDDDQLHPDFRHRWFIEDAREPLPTLYDADGYPVIQFEPVPQLRRRRVGWDAQRQQAFIALLARVPSVGHAAKAVGMSARSAYKLLDKPGAQEFARAWDMALEHGMARLRCGSMTRSIAGGDFVPVYRRGKLVRVEHRSNDRLAIALLSGKDHDVDHYRRGAQVRWRQKREWAALDADRAAAIEAKARALEEEARRVEQAIRLNRVPRVRCL